MTHLQRTDTSSARAGEPYQQAVVFQHGVVTLAGTLWLPAALDHPCPAVALAHGSGDDDRSGYEVFARAFASQGIAALTYDKRGVGGSTGQWRNGTFEELAGDAAAAVALLARRPEVDAQRVGLWGVSEGGWVAPLAAARSAEIRFLVVVSPVGMSPAAQELYRRRLLISASTSSALLRAVRLAGVHVVFWAVRHAPSALLPGLAGYFHRTMDFDPAPLWRAVAQPVLLVFGAADKSVPTRESAQLIERALQDAGRQRYTIRFFPAADHAIRTLDAATGKLAFAPGYLDSVAAWILAQ
jgi:dipeptidyl aminopeptidase/acylaminoacyl peptidase